MDRNIQEEDEMPKRAGDIDELIAAFTLNGERPKSLREDPSQAKGALSLALNTFLAMGTKNVLESMTTALASLYGNPADAIQQIAIALYHEWAPNNWIDQYEERWNAYLADGVVVLGITVDTIPENWTESDFIDRVEAKKLLLNYDKAILEGTSEDVSAIADFLLRRQEALKTVFDAIDTAITEGAASPDEIRQHISKHASGELTPWEITVVEYYEHNKNKYGQETIARKFNTSRSNLAIVLKKYETITGKTVRPGRGRKRS